MSVREQLRWWAGIAALFVLMLWLLGDVLLPFVMGGAIAYFLDPLADRLEARGLGRTLSVVLVTIFSFAVILLLLLMVMPLLVGQLMALIEVLPGLVTHLQAFLHERLPTLMKEVPFIATTLNGAGATVTSGGTALLARLLSSAVTVIDFFVFLVVVPVVAFYMLLDWDRMTAAIDRLLPRQHAPTIRRLAREIDQVLASFVRGQLSVCAILGTYYAVLLALLGLDYGIAVGAIAGLITFIPYIGATVGGLLAIGLALNQFWGDWAMVAAVAAVFVSGQFLEGNVLTPKLVGRSVGLHPVWLLLALSAFGRFFGFLGMLVAVPVAAILKVLIAFLVEQYRTGRLYLGDGTPPPDDAPPPTGKDGAG